MKVLTYKPRRRHFMCGTVSMRSICNSVVNIKRERCQALSPSNISCKSCLRMIAKRAVQCLDDNGYQHDIDSIQILSDELLERGEHGDMKSLVDRRVLLTYDYVCQLEHHQLKQSMRVLFNLEHPPGSQPRSTPQ